MIQNDGYRKLVKVTGKKPKFKTRFSRPAGAPPCTQKILSLLSSGSKCRGALRDEICSLGYDVTTFRNAIRSIKKQDKILCVGEPRS